MPLYIAISNENICFKYKRKIKKIPWKDIKIIKLGKEGYFKPLTIIKLKNGKEMSHSFSNEVIIEIKKKANCNLMDNE